MQGMGFSLEGETPLSRAQVHLGDQSPDSELYRAQDKVQDEVCLGRDEVQDEVCLGETKFKTKFETKKRTKFKTKSLSHFHTFSHSIRPVGSGFAILLRFIDVSIRNFPVFTRARALIR
jgi:hypothetical protein